MCGKGILIWEKKMQGPAVYLAMTGRAREAVREILTTEPVVMMEWIRLSGSWIPYFIKMRTFCRFYQ